MTAFQWVFRVSIVVSILSWACCLFFMWRMSAHGNRLRSAPWYVTWNPVNIVLRPDLWDEEGREDGLRFLVSLGLFVGAAVVAFVAALLRAALVL